MPKLGDGRLLQRSSGLSLCSRLIRPRWPWWAV